LVAETTDLKNSGIALPAHVLPVRLEKHISRDLQADQPGHGHFPLLLQRQEFYNCLTLLECSKIGLIETDLFAKDSVKIRG
jgi:hypothetical protein